MNTLPTIHPKLSHQYIDARTLAMCRLIADKLRHDPTLVRVALRNLERWKQTLQPWPRALSEWEEILERHPLEEVLRVLTEESEEGARRRQNQPFAGVLTQRERMEFLQQYDAPRA
ncbi:MAG: hypothetical protein HZA90_01855 [Verrucomicrobia bacterium]|nr:hypothetical protein [Verrucomicrobiota bacterium]